MPLFCVQDRTACICSFTAELSKQFHFSSSFTSLSQRLCALKGVAWGKRHKQQQQKKTCASFWPQHLERGRTRSQPRDAASWFGNLFPKVGECCFPERQKTSVVEESPVAKVQTVAQKAVRLLRWAVRRNTRIFLQVMLALFCLPVCLELGVLVLAVTFSFSVTFQLSKMFSLAFQFRYRYDWLAAVLLLCPSTHCPVISDNKHKKWFTKQLVSTMGLCILGGLSMLSLSLLLRSIWWVYGEVPGDQMQVVPFLFLF